jgi:hypothetical protein
MNVFNKVRVLALAGSLVLTINCSKNSDDTVETDPGGIDKTGNLLATGDSAHDILANDTFTKLLIEIDYVSGFQPSMEAMNNLQAFLQARTFKQEVEILYDELPSPNEDDLSLQEIANLETGNRTVYNDGTTLAIYIYFADAPSVDDDPIEGTVTLGAVYRNTSMIIHESTVRKLALQSNQVTIADVETATLNHEFGHLLGLVNLGTTPVNDHEDPNAIHHCDIQGCIMSAELQFGSGVMGILNRRVAKETAAVPGLDAECILDLQQNGGR